MASSQSNNRINSSFSVVIPTITTGLSGNYSNESEQPDENNDGGGRSGSGEEVYFQHKYYYETLLESGYGVSIKGQGIKLNADEDVTSLLETIKNCHNLKYLELEGNSLGITVSKSIGKLLESHTEIEAALWKDLFTGRLKDEIPKALNYLLGGIDLSGARLQRLDLSDNAIGPVGMAGLRPFFRSKSAFSLKELILSNEGLGPEGGTTFAEALIDCHKMSLNHGDPFYLKVLICGRNRLENKAATKFAEFFSLVGSLEEIHMPQNGINPPGIRALAASFKSNPNIRILNLNDNTIRPDGAVDLAEALSTLQHLEELNLGDCLLRNDGVISILNAIPKKLKSLLILNFESNEITKHVGLQIAKVVSGFPSLFSVQLGYNEFGIKTIEDMNNILKQYSNSERQIDFEDDTGSGNEDEDDQGERDEEWENYKGECGEEEGDSTEDETTEDGTTEDDEEDYNPERHLEQGYGDFATEVEPGDDGYNFWGKTSSPGRPDGSLAPQASNNNLFTFGSSFSFDTPTFGMASNPLGSIASTSTTTLVEEFIQHQTFPNYIKLSPEAGKKIIQYFEMKCNDKSQFSEECISMALNVSNIVGFGVQTQDCFNELMSAALKSSSANTFITTILIDLGLIHGEEKNVKTKVELVTDVTIKALTTFLGQGLVPIIVLRCAQEFFKPNTPAAKSNIQVPGRDKLLDAVNRQLVLLK